MSNLSNRKIVAITTAPNPNLPSNPNEYQMTSKLCTGMSPRYVKNWTTIEAIREVLQNYLDAKNEFNVGGVIERYRKSKDFAHPLIRVEDFGPGLKPQHLALGVSEKSSNAIGRFGKGLKQAFLVLAREDRLPLIETNSQFIEPCIEWSDDYNTEILMLNIYENQKPNSQKPVGTRFFFYATQEELEIAQSYFIEFLQETNKFSMVTDRLSTPGGSVFVSGSKVGSIEDSVFSYHVTHEQAEYYKLLSSDRDMINSEALKKCISSWSYSGKLLNEEVFTALLKTLKNNSDIGMKFEHSIYMYSPSTDSEKEDLKEVLFKTLKSRDVLISDDYANDKEARYRKMLVLSIPYGWNSLFKGIGIRTTTQWLADNKPSIEPDIIPWTSLIRDGLANLTIAVERANEIITSLCYENNEFSFFYHKWSQTLNESNVVVVRNLNEYIGNAGVGTTFSGCYCRESNRIMLTPRVTYDYRKLLEVLLHEFAHKLTQAEDVSQEFERGLGLIASHALSPNSSITDNKGVK